MNRRLLPLLLVILLLCPACGSQQATEPENTRPPISETRRQASKQADLLKTAFGRDENGENIYPEEYAGHYIGKDDLLHILIVDGAEPGCYDHIVDADYVRYETVKYSFNALCAAQTRLWEDAQALAEDGVLILNGLGVDQKANCISITVPNTELISPMVERLEQMGIAEDMYSIEIGTNIELTS